MNIQVQCSSDNQEVQYDNNGMPWVAPRPKYLFISRHEPTAEQYAITETLGIEMEWLGDADAFTVDEDFVLSRGTFAGVIIVHPAAAMRLCDRYIIGVFENGTRADMDGKPQFYPKALHLFNKRGY